jgi:hypothetical protein
MRKRQRYPGNFLSTMESLNVIHATIFICNAGTANLSPLKKLDPHDQLNADGEIIAEKCLYCHTEKPNERNATFENIKLVGDIKMICRRCHNILDKHPAGENHFRIPDIKMLKMIKRVETSYNVTLPLDYKGRVTCITCHNPHERGVIPNERKGAKGAGKKHRQRLAGIMCNACHEL